MQKTLALCMSDSLQRDELAQTFAQAGFLVYLAESSSEVDELGKVDFIVFSTQLEGVTLTAREWEVAGMVRDGLTNRKIAEKLGVSKKTVENHRYNLTEKLGIHRKAKLCLLSTINRHNPHLNGSA